MSTFDIWGGQLLRDTVDGWVLRDTVDGWVLRDTVDGLVLRDMGAMSCLYFSIHELRQDATKLLNP